MSRLGSPGLRLLDLLSPGQGKPAGGGAPYQVEIKEAIPRLYIPMILPGAPLGVMIDPTNPMHVSPDWSRVGSYAAPLPATCGAGDLPASRNEIAVLSPAGFRLGEPAA